MADTERTDLIKRMRLQLIDVCASLNLIQGKSNRDEALRRSAYDAVARVHANLAALVAH